MISYRILNSVTDREAADMLAIYLDVSWWSADGESEWIRDIPAASSCFAAAFDGEKMIGFGRALSDNISDAYIQDIAVLTRYRGQSIGSGIVSALTATLTKRGVDWIGLIAVPGAESFYKKLGFYPIPDTVPMKYNPESNP